MKHTKGPRKIEGAAILHDNVVMALCSSTGANARLIAAAPDLLEACREALDEINYIYNKLSPKQRRFCSHTMLAATKQIGAAIAKAEGKE